MKKLLVVLVGFGLVVSGLFCQAIQAVEDEGMMSIGTDSNESVLVMVIEEHKISISVDEYDEGEEDDEDDSGDEDEEY